MDAVITRISVWLIVGFTFPQFVLSQVDEGSESEIVRMLNSDDFQDQMNAALTIDGEPFRGEYRLAIPALANRLDFQTNPTQRPVIARYAIEALRKLAIHAAENGLTYDEFEAAMPKIVALANHESSSLRIAALRTIPWAAKHCRREFVSPIVDDILNAARSDDDEISVAALECLAQLGTYGPNVLPLMLELIRDEKDPEISGCIAAVIGAIAQDPETSIPALMNSFDSLRESGKPRFWDEPVPHLKAIEAFGNQASAATDWLLPLLWDDADNVRRDAMLALASIDSENPLVLQALEDARKASGGNEVYEIPVDFEDPVIDFDSLITDIKSSDWRIRLRAMEAISFQNASPQLRQVIPDFIESLSSHHGGSSIVARNVLRMIADCAAERGDEIPELEPALEAFLQSYNDATTDNRRWELENLGLIAKVSGPTAVRRTLPVFIDALNDDDESVVTGAMRVLGKFGVKSESVDQSYVRNLDGNDRLCEAAARAIGVVGVDASQCVPALVQQLKRIDRGDPQCKEPGLSILESIGNFGTDAGEAVPELLPFLDAESGWIKHQAVKTLSKIGDTSEQAIVALETAFAKNRPGIQSAVFEALCMAGPTGRASATRLAEALEEFSLSCPDRTMIIASGFAHSYSELPEFGQEYPGVGVMLDVLMTSRTLKHLDLGECSLSDSDFKKLSIVGNLSEITLPFTTTDEDLASLASMSCSRIKRLQIGTQQSVYFGLGRPQIWIDRVDPVSDKGMQQLELFSELTSLSIPFCHVGDQGLLYLKFCPNLEVLKISSAMITDEGIQHLSPLTRLVELNLDGSGVGDAGIARLVAQNPNLRRLSLRKSKITGACAADLVKLKYLEELTILQTRIVGDDKFIKSDSVALTEIIRGLPNCKVVFR